jgi:hypothetical protein
MYLEELRKTKNDFNKDRRCLCHDSNQARINTSLDNFAIEIWWMNIIIEININN